MAIRPTGIIPWIFVNEFGFAKNKEHHPKNEYFDQDAKKMKKSHNFFVEERSLLDLQDKNYTKKINFECIWECIVTTYDRYFNIHFIHHGWRIG